MLQNKLVGNNLQTIQDDFSAWLASHGKNGRGHSQKSIEAHLSDLRGFAEWFEPHARQPFAPELITSGDLRAYFTYSTQERRVSASTWNRRRISLALFCQFSLAEGKSSYNAFQGIPTKEKQQTAPRSLNKSDYLCLLRRVEQAVNTARTENQRRMMIRNRAMISLMVFAGLRVGELCALHRDDLLLSDRKGEVHIVDGKGHKSGVVPLGRECRIAVSEWLKLCPDELLFGGITGRQVERIVEGIGNQAGMEIHPHMLRHTFVYNALNQTGNLVIAKELARHNRIDQTARYAMPHKEDLEKAVENL